MISGRDNPITVSAAQYALLLDIQRAAVQAIQSAIVRNVSSEFHARWLEDMNALAVLLPVTRKFDIDPLT